MAKIGEFYKLKGHEEHLYMLAYVEAVKVASVGRSSGWVRFPAV